jgi:hypothetical protein
VIAEGVKLENKETNDIKDRYYWCRLCLTGKTYGKNLFCLDCRITFNQKYLDKIAKEYESNTF